MRIKKITRRKFIIILLTAALALPAARIVFGQGQQDQDETMRLRRQLDSMRHSFNQLEKHIDDVLWYHRVGDIALIDKVRLTGPPPWKEENPTAQGAGNPVKFYAYVFIPRSLDPDKKSPLLVFPHGGVHSNFTTYYTHIVRELITQGYVIIAADYRGSTGYGAGMYQLIDYGGREVEDVYATRSYMLKNYDFCDPDRVGILGWSHGGLITLMNIFNHPDDYKAAFAGVPVSDLIARMGYKTQSYRDLYSADYHIGQTAYENVNEYRRRSPAWQAEKLKTPLLIHTNTNDADVNVLEVEHLIKSLKAAGKKFEYTIYQDKPGGHSFDRLDTWEAKTIRLKIYRFLEKHLNPPNPFANVEELHLAGYQTPVQK
jgi:dipeptidyl aminopeptidase/acylaminoacyl peptidase